MYVAPESKVLLALANVAATSAGGETTVDPNDESNWSWEPPCL